MLVKIDLKHQSRSLLDEHPILLIPSLLFARYPFDILAMRLLIPSTAIVAAGFVGQGAAIRTVPSSPCASLCGDVTSTTGADILCTDADLQTAKGQVFSNCISCQITSKAIDSKTGDTDLKWVLCRHLSLTPSCRCVGADLRFRRQPSVCDE